MSVIKNTFYSGTSGLALPVPQALYPEEFQGKSRLIYYASLFNSVEINSSFYKMPRVSTISKWAESVPEYFQFTFKLSKAVTHIKGLLFNAEDVDLFIKTIANIGNKKGCLLVQFPPGLKVEKINQLEKLLVAIKNADSKVEWRVAVEFRNTSWYNEEVYALLDEYNASMVMHDLPASATPFITPACNFVYLRFHGTVAGYRGSYTDEFLHKHAQNIKEWMLEKKSVYCYFNNTIGDAVKNLITLNRLLGSINYH